MDSTDPIELLITLELLDRNNRPSNLDRRDDDWIRSRLDYYFKTRSRSADAETQSNCHKRKGIMALVSSISVRNAVMPLLPLFLLYDHLVTDDPLFRAATPEHEHTVAQKQALGVAQPHKPIERTMIANRLLYFSVVFVVVNILIQ
jgi:hypothetical protein